MNDRIKLLLDELLEEIEEMQQEQDDDDDSPVNETSVVDEIPLDHQREDGPELPLVMVRDSVKSSRDGGNVQIPVYEATRQMWTDGRSELKLSFEEEEVSVMDINEAILLAGLKNLDDAYQVLEAWGYGVDRSL